MAGTPVEDESIIGDECHIVSAVPGGPRYDPEFARPRVDDHSNLLLLCKVHHKMIDDQVLKYNASHLTNLKVNHEKWVSERLDTSDSHTRPLRVRRVTGNSPTFLQRIHSGEELLAIVTNAYAYAHRYDDLRNEMEDDLVAGFLQEAQDWGEVGLESVSNRMRAARSLDERIGELERAKLWVFGCREKRILEGGTGPDTDWPVAHVWILRSDNPEITIMADSAE